ncbi:CRISPR-associated endonuclease Cas2 [Pseudoalteromonas sp. MMG013]|uniref:CRISPR-associated endonuclease Cas2 n=1 Tax=Pseudoalteromonas sp. MMG013 TaxID=2822687 RepID=UPI001B3736F9|nr:CRISPR-associated endonuclease Cas2 [Pseudoalteromonas sp. MMG013]MBQ4863006.1 CRISPR-associated endonuclease Cas2 [Pseudoalteromonas sp. MMG013]
MPHHYVICYDTPCDKRRYRIDKTLAGYGERIQLSVYECCLSESQFTRLRHQIRQIVTDDDALNYYPVCCHCQLRRHGIASAVVYDPSSFEIF